MVLFYFSKLNLKKGVIVCKKKTNKAKRVSAQIKTDRDEIREIIRLADNLRIREKTETIKDELGLH